MSAVHPITWAQIRTMTSASIKSRYRNTFAGVVWVVLSPLMMYTAQGYVFKRVLQIHHPNYPLFLLTGLLPWIFLTQSTSMATTLFVNNARLFKSFPIHPLVSLISVIADNLLNFCLTFLVILVGLLAFGNPGNVVHFLILPLPFSFMFVAVVGMCWFLATLQVFFHDVRFIVDFALSILFFLTPVFYPADFVPAGFEFLFRYNPIALLLAPIQALSQDGVSADYPFLLAKSALVAVLSVCLATGFWRWKKNDVYFRL